MFCIWEDQYINIGISLLSNIGIGSDPNTPVSVGLYPLL